MRSLPVRAAAGHLLLYLPVQGICRSPPSALSFTLLRVFFFSGRFFSVVALEEVFFLNLVGYRALLHVAVRLLLGPVGGAVVQARRLLYPGVVVPLRDGPGLEIFLVLGFAVKRCLRFVILVLGFTARFGSDVPVLEVLARHRVAHALLGDAASRRACRRSGAGLCARWLRFYGDPRLGRRLQLDVLQLRHIRVLGEDQRHRDVSLVQLVPEAGHAARPADAGPRHGGLGELRHTVAPRQRRKAPLSALRR